MKSFLDTNILVRHLTGDPQLKPNEPPPSSRQPVMN
jgi:hypothetical protein